MQNIWIINHNIIPPSLGGLNRHYYFKKYINRENYHLTLFTSSFIHNTNINMITDNRKICKKVIDNVEFTYLKTNPYKTNGLKRILNMLCFGIRILKLPKIIGDVPDYIYTSSPDLFTAYFAIKLSKKIKKPCYVEIRDFWPKSIVAYGLKKENNILIKMLYKLEEYIYKNSSKIIFTMEGGFRYLEEKGYLNCDKAFIKSENIHYINNGVDLDNYNNNKNKFIIRDDDLFSDNFKVIYTGSIRFANKVDKILDVAKLMKNEKIIFLIYGKGDQVKNIEKRIIEEDINNVKLKGFFDKKYLPYILSRSNLNIILGDYVSVFEYGNSMNKMFDYFASGKPLLITFKTEFSLVEKYQAGIELKNSDTNSIVNSIKYFLALSDDKYKKYCNNSIQVANDYDYRILTKKFEKLFQK